MSNIRKARTAGRLGMGICLATLLAIVAMGCGDSQSDSEATSTAPADDASTTAAADYGDCDVTGQEGQYTLETNESGTLTVGTVLPLPGYFNGSSPSEVEDGYEYCLAADIAYQSGLELKIENVSFDRMIAGRFGDIDMVMAGVFITPEREKVVDFSIPYYTSYTGVLVRSDDGVTEDSIKESTIGVLAGTLQQEFVENKLGVQPKTFTALADLTTAVAAKQIDAAMIDTTTLLTAASKSDGALEVVGQYRAGGENGIVFPKGSPNTAPVDEILQSLIDDGETDRLRQEYLVPALGGDPDDVPFWTP